MKDSENTPAFKHIDLILHVPEFGSALASDIINLETLRVRPLLGSIPPKIFIQLRAIFQKLESLGSARIEGNRTTLADYVEHIISKKSATDERAKEIENLEKAIQFIEKEIVFNTPITKEFLFKLHQMIVDGLTVFPDGEGSKTPGKLREVELKIQNHRPPLFIKTSDYFSELLEFINKEVEPKYDLLVAAIAHHRCAWIHPFDNGNGRFVRMLTYAMLLKQGFRVQRSRIINPTTIFCVDREKYYAKLAQADSGNKEDSLEWCHYVLNGLSKEIEKIDKLTNGNYVKNNILRPAILFTRENNFIAEREFLILTKVIDSKDMVIRAPDINTIVGNVSTVQRARIIAGLKKKEMLLPTRENGREYTVGFSNNYLLRGVVKMLEKEGFTNL